MTRNHVCALWRILLVVTLASSCYAAPLELIYTGVFNTRNALNVASQGSPAYFTTPTPFTLNAWFDSNSPNLAPAFPPAPPPFGGFRAYSPSLMTVLIGSTSYRVETFAENPTAGATVAIFDKNSFTPDRYGIGILQQPPQDGAGFVGDFLGASPDFIANALQPTVFTGYQGVGYGSGVCLVGTGGNCSLNAVTPFILHGSNGTVWSLTLGNYSEDYSLTRDPASPNLVGSLNTAQLLAVPEPGTLGLTSIAVALLLGLRRHRGNR